MRIYLVGSFFVLLVLGTSIASAQKQPASALLAATTDGSFSRNLEDVSGTPDTILTIDISGEASWDALNDPDNTILAEVLGSGALVTGVGWDVTISTIGASWLSEATMYFDGFDQDGSGLFLTPGVGDSMPGTGSYSSGGILDLTDNGIANIPILADGALYLQFFESFDDVGDAIDAYYDPVSTIDIAFVSGPDIRVEPLTLTVTQGTPKPIFVELDWMDGAGHSHQPSQAVIDQIVDTFAAAGYSINIDVSNAIPHQAVVDVTGSPSGSPAIQALIDQNFDHVADDRYYYSLWLHNYSFNGNFTSSSGIADLPGRVHIVSLGSFSGQTGTFSNQVGTFIHEFGHNLNQYHGGVDHGNYKPNYLSVMNYHYQLGGIGPTLLALGLANTSTGFDDFAYSHGLLANLDENNLDERFGIGLGRAVDWDCDTVIEPSVATDIQASSWCAAASSQSVITDYDNWGAIGPQIRIWNSAQGVPESSGPCMSWVEYRQLHLRLEHLRAVGVLPPDGPRSLRRTAKTNGNAFHVYNDGSSTLTVTALELDVATPWIQWEPQAPFIVEPGESQEVLVYVDLERAPAGQTQRQLLVSSDDPDENPYPGGVFLVVNGLGNCTLTTGASPVVGGSTTGDATVACGTDMTAKVFPNPGYNFVRWTEGGATVSTSASYTFTLDADRNLVAELSNGSPDVELTRGVGYNDTIDGTTQQGTWKYYYMDLPTGSTSLLAELYDLPATPPQDVDLYLRFGSKPTLADWDCRPFLGNGSAEQCNVPAPVAGRWWIGINNWDTGPIDYTIRTDWSNDDWIFGDGFESGDTSSWQ